MANQIDGVQYPADYQAAQVLHRVRKDRIRVRITHRTPDGEWTSTGYVSSSMGPRKIAIVLHNSRSRYGDPLSGAIVKIEHSNKRQGGVIWEAPKLPTLKPEDNGCLTCARFREERERGEYGQPTHDGSYWCRSGSIASGGTRAHCACSACF